MLDSKIHISTKLFIYFYMLHNLRFFQFEPYVKLSSILTFIDIAFCLYFLFLFLHHGLKMRKTPAWKSMTIFYVIFILSILNAYFQYGQSLYYGFRAIVFTYMNIGFFYYLSYKNIPTKFLIRICWTFLILYVAVLIISIIQFPNNVFGYRSSIDAEDTMLKIESDFEARGTYRFSFLGGDYIALMLFYVIMQRKKLKYTTLLIFALLVLTLMRGTRGPIIATFAMSIIAYMISKRSKLKSIIYVSILSIIIYIMAINIPFTSNIINSIIQTTESQIAETGEENIRLVALNYYGGQFNEGKTMPMIIGNGAPSERSSYGQKIIAANSIGLYENDIEYLQWYIYFGIIGLLALLYWGKAFVTLKIPSEYAFIKIFIAYIFIVMILGSHFFREIPMIAMLCYILYRQNIIITKNARTIS